MTMQAIKEAAYADPFRPFTLRVGAGPTVKVAHPDYIAFGPKGRTVVVYGSNESFRLIHVMLVTELDIPESSRPKR